ncbi:integrin alpha, partial [uncultured Aquimarina sp.]|uniref:integrin alpha n=1 Tax=uncultured Aquimarina sp. TaxID=575652 RepID=UPI002618E9E0
MKNKSIVTFIIKNVVFIFLCYLNCSTSQAQNQLYPANFDITSLNGSNGFRIPGVEASSQFGAETKFIGDINNDGLEDISISFSSAERGGVVGAGVVYIIFGSDTGFPSVFDVNILNGSNGFVFEGITQTEAIGLVVEGVGDINGDGIDDVVIGASRFSPGIVVLYGKSSPFNAVINRNDIGFSEGFTIITNSVSTQMNDIGALGDVNGDGRNDFILGKAIGGDAWIFFGRPSNFPISVDASWLDGMNGFRTSSYSNSLREAYLVGGTGDINNDGFNDIILGDWSITSGSSFIERTHVIFGRNSFDPLVDVTSLDGSNGFVVDHTGGNFLAFTGTLGDINGDGIDDFFSETAAIFGKESTDPFPAYIPFSSVQDGTYGFILPGGLTSASIGDVNQDGINDFISVYRAESGPDANAYIVFGNTTGFPNPINESSLNGVNGFVIPGFRTSNIGRPVSGDGDFNGDGISDFIVGSPGETPEGSTDRTGEAYVIFGGDHYAMPLNNGYPQAIDETISGFTLLVNGPETGTIHYAIFPGNFSGTVDYDDVLNGVGATENGNFLMDVANTDVEEVISSLNASTTYDIYLFLEDGVGNQGQIYHINDVTTLSNSDTENPTASDPLPINIQCSANVPASDIAVVTDEADNSGVTPTVAFESDVSNGNSNPEIIIRTYSITDEAGNSINVTQTITINDTTDPTASDPTSIIVACISDVPAPDIAVV